MERRWHGASRGVSVSAQMERCMHLLKHRPALLFALSQPMNQVEKLIRCFWQLPQVFLNMLAVLGLP